MRRLHRVIYQEVLPPGLVALLILTFVVFTREFGRLAELLIRKNADLITVLQVVVFLLPSILIFTVPFAFLIGTLIGFSRLSTDSEVVAMRACGVSVYQMIWPVLKLGVLVSLLTGCLTLFLLPAGNWSLRQLRHEIRLSPTQSQLKPRVFNEDLPGMVLYVEDVDLHTSSWKGVFLADTSEEGEKRIVIAREGVLLSYPDRRRLQLHLDQGSIYKVHAGTPEKDTISTFRTLDLPIDFPEVEEGTEKEKRPEDKNLQDLFRDLRQGTPEHRRTSAVELHRRIALPLGALLFAALGVTLGINTHRGGRGYGFVVSMIVAFTYYILFATGSELAMHGVLPLGVGVWGANLLMGVLALMGVRLSTRDSLVWQALSSNSLLLGILDRLRRGGSRLTLVFQGLSRRLQERFWRLPRWRLRMARVIDLYMVRSFLLYFVFTVSVCAGLFYLFTFFELLDELYAHQVSYHLLLEYFFFLLPHILMLLIPISILIATLVTFGLLEKTNQITALKSCGVSVYRCAAPVVVVVLLICSFVFILQEHILPYANQRQDHLRALIKGRPVQTFQPGRHWIFGTDNRLYHYSHYNPERLVFAEFSSYELDISASRLFQHVYAQRAEWDRSGQQWKMYNGWVRSFQADTFAEFSEMEFHLPETPDYFAQEVKDSNKMTYQELARYILELQRGGFEVDHLRTELYKKLAFPLVNVVMVILGLPFAFSMGRRGALYGIAAGVLIGIFYWGAFGVFELLGSNGMLSPLLAAWGPNLIFGAGATLLLSAVRT